MNVLGKKLELRGFGARKVLMWVYVRNIIKTDFTNFNDNALNCVYLPCKQH